MATKAFAIPTVPSRIEGLKTLLKSISVYIDDWDIIIAAQCYTEAQKADMLDYIKSLGLESRTIFKTSDKPLGSFGGRKLCLKSDYDIYCNLDDDMEVIETQNYNAMAEHAMKDSVGIVAGNWGRNLKLAQAKIPKMRHEFVKHTIVHTGGGAVFARKIRDVIMHMPDNLAYDDSEMALMSFVNGYDNYRYMGHVVVHAIVTKGGLRDWRRVSKGALPNSMYFDYKPTAKKFYDTEGQNYHEPYSQDVKPFARTMHLKNKKKREGNNA